MPRAEADSRSPEFRLAMGALAGLRRDLFHDVFAYRPLAPLTGDGPVVRRLPARIRRYAVWTPHAVVAGGALLVLIIGASVHSGVLGPVTLVFAAVSAATVLMTLVRPVLAFWASLASTPFLAALGSVWGDGPWTPATVTAHLAVLTVVAARTRPRAAFWMWVLTGAHGMVAGTVLGVGYPAGSTGLMSVSAVVLLVVALAQVRRDAEREVAAQQSVTAVERDRRTLLEERTTIARELHDVVAHHMSVVAIQAEAAPYRVQDPPPELAQAFATIRENAVAALTELRRVLGVVRAEDYEAPDAPQPTLADLDGLLGNVRDAGLDVGLTTTGAVRQLPPGVELSAYRITQEALSNALRHAPGASAKVEVAYVLGGLGVRIANGPARGLRKPAHPAGSAGRGPRPAEPVQPAGATGSGHGLTGMRERVSMLNGEMATGPTEDGGYEVAVFLPVAKDETV
ncbi:MULTISPECIES: sensor histidine kinase [unclassified Streptomyces]|uniref:sensor histidine kinase n=1 Tax=unclassified Streptomyces TaxID=2593676 RepID=UPI000F4564D7|nr:histidine kinase [Streptomyces sp. I6]RNL74199.1 two-component sensor histidine kinase [Streptomyces sp. I6]